MTSPLVVVWVCCTLAILIMFTRLVIGRYCKTKWDTGDSLTILAIILSIARIAFTHVVIVWKTNNISDVFRETHKFTDSEIMRRELGSKFTLVARSLYISLLWIQKLVLLRFYRVLVKDMPWGKKTLLVYRVVFVATLCASFIATFTECRPLHLYWQVLPDPGNCSQAIAQLYIVGITNIFTDLMLICLPIPVLLQVRLSLSKKLQLGFLFSIGFMIVAITAVRIPFTIESRSSETIRITWTTGEFLAATFVANAPTLYSFRHLVHRRTKQPLRRFSRSAPHMRAQVLDDLESPAMSLTEVAPPEIKYESRSGTDPSENAIKKEEQ